MEANNSLLPLSSGRPSTADQKAAIFSTLSQSKLMLPILVAMASSLVGASDRRTGSGGQQRDPSREILGWPACRLDHGQDVLIMVACD
jgi:hypothetical protein